MTTRDTLEAALAAEPENRVLHAAYADLLIEDGDPRGEAIRLELALEDDGLTEGERVRLAALRDELIAAHARDWLGPLHPFADMANPYSPDGRAIHLSWKRGWLDRVRISVLEARIFDALRRCPVNRLIDTIALVHPVVPDEPATSRTCIQILNDIPFRTLILEDFETFGDRLVRILERFLKRLRMFHLVLDHCGLTDDGAHRLAHSRLAADLQSLRLPRNHLSAIGVAALAEAGFTVEERRTGPGWDADGD